MLGYVFAKVGRLSTWLCIPSARPPEQVEPVLAKWRECGYKIALFIDWNPPGYPLEIRIAKGDIMLRGGGRFEPNTPIETMRYAPDFDHYPGYAQAVNALAKSVLEYDPSCDWICTGGDDTLPDPNHTAEEIAAQCGDYFEFKDGGYNRTFGVMQPTGDRFAGGCIDRIAGSPWLGRSWCLRANGGRGPFWPEFTHMFGDECLKRTAEKLGVYWVRPDLTHFHKQFQRESDAIDSRAVSNPVPPHLVKWNTRQHWDEMQAIFRRLEAEDFKSCMPL